MTDKQISKNFYIRFGLFFFLVISIFIYINIDSAFLAYMFYDVEIMLEDEFTKYALAITLAYDALPSILQQFSIGATTTELLQSGFSPELLIVLSSFALLLGQMALYVVGMYIRKFRKGSFGDIAGKNHFLHKHYFLVYLIVPFTNILGDAVMLYSGHERINPLKMIPFLLAGNLASSARWIYSYTIQLGITDSLF